MKHRRCSINMLSFPSIRILIFTWSWSPSFIFFRVLQKSRTSGDWEVPQSALRKLETQEASGVVQRPESLPVGRPENQEHQASEKIDVPVQAGMQRKIELNFRCLFIWFWPSMDWLRPIHIGKGDLFSWVHQFKC